MAKSNNNQTVSIEFLQKAVDERNSEIASLKAQLKAVESKLHDIENAAKIKLAVANKLDAEAKSALAAENSIEGFDAMAPWQQRMAMSKLNFYKLHGKTVEQVRAENKK